MGGGVVALSNGILDPTMALIRPQFGFRIQVRAEFGNILTMSKYFENIWILSGRYLDNILRLFRQYLDTICMIFGKYLENIYKIFGQYFNDIGKTF